MIVDFSTLDLNARQAYILKNLDGTTIQPLLNVIDPHAKLSFNEVSELTFTVPSKIDGVATPHYADIVGMRIIDWDGVGQFILNNPKRTNDGVIELKQCTAYSLEYELGYKRVYIADGTYNLAEVLDMIFENVPSWGRGNLSVKALTRYRTFGGETYNVYDLLKGTLQDLYSCVFEFDTYERLIHVIDANDVIEQRPILISLNNLAKEIVVEENTEELFTCFSVTGADDVDISSVNPLGNNLIYNLDYFMNPSHFSQDFINKWNNWKDAVEANQQAFYMLTIDESLELVRRTTEEAKLLALRAEHSNLETEQTAYTSTGNATKESELYGEYQELLGKTEEKAAEIAQQEKLIESIQTTIDDLFQQKEDIVAACKFDQFFTAEEALLLDKYIRTSDFNEPSFVYREYTTYDTDDISESANQLIVTVSRASITQIPSDSGKELYRITAGGSDTSDTPARLNAIVYKGNSTSDIKGDIVNCIIEKKADSSVILTAELADGTYNNTPFVSACLSILADNFSIYDSDIALDEDVNAQYQTGTRLLVHTDAATVYFTQGVTEYSKRSVEWELYEFAAAELEKAAWPKYQFTVDSANFLSAKEFEVFRKQFKLGTRIYLDLDGGLTPIAIGAEIDLDDPTSLSLTFGDEYSALDSAFQLVDILDQSVSMGKSYSANKGAYGNFISSGSKDALYNFINAPLDVAKNSIISSSDQAIQFDSAGLRLRRYADASMTTYDPEQIWMCHNSIVFTRDNWTTAEMAIGKFEDPYLGEQYGICAPAIMGTIIAGNKLWIRSSTEHGGVAEFQVDGAGARLYNAKFDLCNDDGLGNTGHISLNPELGIVGGIDKTGAPLFGSGEDGSVYGVLTTHGDTLTRIREGEVNYINPADLPRVNFWVDMYGNTYFRGTVYATDGEFSGTVYAENGTFNGTVNATDGVFNGTVYAKNGEFSGTIKAASLEGNIQVNNASADEDYGWLIGAGIKVPSESNPAFTVDKNGDVTTAGSITMDGDIVFGENSTITWNTSNLPYRSMFSVDGSGTPKTEPDGWHAEMDEQDKYRCDSYDGGKTWGAAYQFRGENGEPGSDANVNWANVKAALSSTAAIRASIITIDSVGAPNIYGGNIYGGNIYAGDGSTDYYSQMNDDGFTIWYEGDVKARMYSEGEDTSTPVVGIDLGRGSNDSTSDNPWSSSDTFHITKGAGYAELTYISDVGDGDGEPVAYTIRFDENGISLDSSIAKSTAVFG